MFGTCVVMCVLSILLQCAEEQKHVSESLYPFTFNPKMSLTLSQVASTTQRSPPPVTPCAPPKAHTDPEDSRVSIHSPRPVFGKNVTFESYEQEATYVLWPKSVLTGSKTRPE